MGWQSETDIARMCLSSGHRQSITARIQGGKNGRAFITNMASIIPEVPKHGEVDKWGPKRCFCVGGPKTTTDEMWVAIQKLLAMPCARVHLKVKEFDFSTGCPADGGVHETWIVMDTALLRSFLEDATFEMPESMESVLNSAHETGDGGGWETIIITHTVI